MLGRNRSAQATHIAMRYLGDGGTGLRLSMRPAACDVPY